MRKLFIALLVFAMSLTLLVGVALAGPSTGTNAEALAIIDSHNEGSKIPMSVIAQDLKFPQLIPYFGPTNPGRRFTPLADILLYGNRFVLESVQANVTDAQLRLHDLTRITNPKILNKVMTAIYSGHKKNVAAKDYRCAGYLTTMAINKATSLDAFYIILLIAHKRGSDTVHFTRQGVDFSMYATGWGAAIGGVSGGLNANGEGGQVSTGMLGWATGKSGANRDPWLQAIYLKPRK